MDYETAYRWLHGDRVEYSGCRSAAEAMEAEIDRLRAALWQCFTDAGGDTDGKTDAAGISTDDLISTTTDCVKDLRLGYDEMLDESSEADRLRARIAELESQPADQFTAELVELDGHTYGLRPNAAHIVKEAMADARRYRRLFDCPEPFCYRGEVFETKVVADNAIDTDMRKTP